MRDSHLHRRSVLSRVARGALAVAMVLVATAALLVGGALTFLRTARGGELVRRLALPRVNQSIAGHLDVGRFTFGGDHLRLEGIELRGPDGRRLVRVPRLDVAFSPWALLRGDVALSSVEIFQPDLSLRRDRRGLDLVRALAPAGQQAERGEPGVPGEKDGGIVVEVEQLLIRGAHVDLRLAPPAGAVSHVELAGLDARAHARVQTGSGAVRAAVKIDGRVDAPLDAPLALSGELEVTASGAVKARAAVDLEQSAARAQVTRASEQAPLRVSGALVRLSPAVARTFLDVPLLTSVVARGGVALDGERLDGQLDVDAGGGHVALEADVDLATARAHRLVLTGSDLDLGRVVEGLPRSRLALALRGRGGGRALDELSGDVQLTMPRGTLSGMPIGPVTVDASAEGGRLRLRALRAALPGLTVEARGEASPERLDLRLDVAARDLAATARSLGPLTGRQELAGRGSARVHVTGTPRAPGVAARGALGFLRAGDIRVEELAFDARLPDVHQPLRGQLSLTARRARIAGRDLRDLEAAVRARGPRLSADLRVGGDAPLRLAARGRVDRGGGLVSVDALSLATPEVRWRQRGGPIRVDLGPRPALHGLALEAGRQRLAADVDVQRQRVTADVHVAHLELARLPALLVPERLRARATIDLDARVDVPLRWPVRDAGARTFAQVDLQVAGAQSLLPLVGLEQVRLTGPLRLRLSLDGTARRPVLSGRLSIEGLGIDGQPIGDVTLALNGEGEGPLDARLAVQPGAGGLAAGQLTATTRLSLSRLARRPPRGDEWLDLPFVVRGDVGRFPLGALARAFGREPLGGTVALRFSADGSARAPTGALSLDVSGATGPRLPPTDLRVDVSLGQRDTRVAARLSRSATAAGAGGQARVLAWLSAVVGLPGRRLTDASAIERAPLDVRLGVGPLDLQRLGAAAVAGDDAPSLRGHARLDAALTGTARAPVARATVDVRGVTLGAAPFGAAHAQLVYADGRAKVDADVSSANGGALHLSARATADLGYPAVARGLRVDQVPLRADLKADRFDLRWLSGWSRSVRRVGGTLDADVHLAGTAPAPRVTGRIDWRDGQLALTGMGDYDDIRLSAHGDQGALRLDRLTARSGGGTARASGRVERRDGEARLELDAHLSRFPVYGQGQVMARVSLDADAEGTASTEGLDASASIAEAHVELVDRSKKDLPALERPADFVLFRDGAPMNADERRKLRALLAARDPSAPQPALDDGRRAVRLAITAPRNLWLRGKDANLEIGLDPGFRVEVGERPRVFGRVVVRRGRVEALGRRFDVVAGSTATFTGPPDEPVLDVKARHTNTRENVTVLIALKGTLDDLDIAVSSPERPDLTETQLYTLIVTGRLGLGGGGPSAPLSSQAASLVGGLLAAQLQRVLSDKLPLDVLTLQTGDGMSGTRLEAGTYVSSDLYVGYVGRAGANPALLQNRNAVHLEYQISPRWSFNAEYGDVGTGTADLFWTKRY